MPSFFSKRSRNDLSPGLLSHGGEEGPDPEASSSGRGIPAATGGAGGLFNRRPLRSLARAPSSLPSASSASSASSSQSLVPPHRRALQKYTLAAAQVSLAAVQVAVCLGAVYLKSALSSTPHRSDDDGGSSSSTSTSSSSSSHSSPEPVFSPPVYAFCREALAGLILCSLAALFSPAKPSKADLPKFAALGTLMFLNQLLYLTGIDRAGVSAAAKLQPAIPVFTAALASALGLEALGRKRAAGIALAAGGALAMVVASNAAVAAAAKAAVAAAAAAASTANAVAASTSSSGDTKTDAAALSATAAAVAERAARAASTSAAAAASALFGRACLVLNTLCMSLYYLLSKQLVARYPPLCVAGWAHVPAALLMSLAAASAAGPPFASSTTSSSSSATAAAAAVNLGWALPRQLWGPLAYWVLVCSVAGYAATAWASKVLPASQVASFQCLQPFVGTALAWVALGERGGGVGEAVGALALLLGLVLVTSGTPPSSAVSLPPSSAAEAATKGGGNAAAPLTPSSPLQQTPVASPLPIPPALPSASVAVAAPSSSLLQKGGALAAAAAEAAVAAFGGGGDGDNNSCDGSGGSSERKRPATPLSAPPGWFAQAAAAAAAAAATATAGGPKAALA